MDDHWLAIISAVCVAVAAIVVKYNFVLKRDCDKAREVCQRGLCKKIEDAGRITGRATNGLSLGARDINEVLIVLQREVSEIKSALSKLTGSFEQYIKNGK